MSLESLITVPVLCVGESADVAGLLVPLVDGTFGFTVELGGMSGGHGLSSFAPASRERRVNMQLVTLWSIVQYLGERRCCIIK